MNENNSFANVINSIKYIMLLKNFMEWKSWLAWDEGTTGEKCGVSTELIAENSSLSEGLFTGRGKIVIFSVSKHYDNDTNLTGLRRRRSGIWNHLNRSYG